MTPEGKVKKAIKAKLWSYGVVPFDKWDSNEPYVGMYYMPVAGPFAKHGVHDFIGCWGGVFFSIEAKAEDNPVDATTNQEQFAWAVHGTGGISVTGARSADVVDWIKEAVDAHTRK